MNMNKENDKNKPIEVFTREVQEGHLYLTSITPYKDPIENLLLDILQYKLHNALCHPGDKVMVYHTQHKDTCAVSITYRNEVYTFICQRKVTSRVQQAVLTKTK